MGKDHMPLSRNAGVFLRIAHFIFPHCQTLSVSLSPIISSAFLYAKMDLRENLSTSAPSSVTYWGPFTKDVHPVRGVPKNQT